MSYPPMQASGLPSFRGKAWSPLVFRGESHGEPLAVLAVPINLSGPWLFIEALMLFPWCPGSHQSPLHMPLCPLLIVQQLLPEPSQGLSELWMPERTRSLSVLLICAPTSLQSQRRTWGLWSQASIDHMPSASHCSVPYLILYGECAA